MVVAEIGPAVGGGGGEGAEGRRARPQPGEIEVGWGLLGRA